jgi:hypothetical protein
MYNKKTQTEQRIQFVNTGFVGFFQILFLIFVVLKLTGHITWSWWWITAPLWGPLVAFFIIIVILFIIAFILYLVQQLIK